jgi:DNA polymerase-3 subunit epsilon
MTEIVLDLETTGLDPKQGHRIVEIGAIKLRNKSLTNEKFHYYVNPQRDMPTEAYNVHGISSDFLRDKPIFATVADQLLEFIKDSTLIIHNAQFDVKFLNYELALLGKGSINVVNVIDTLKIAQSRYPGKRASLDALCDRFKIDLSHRKLHGALKDAELLAKVYYLMTGGFNQYSLEVEQNIKEMQDLKVERAKITSKVIKPTQVELENHLKLIKKMQNSIWSTHTNRE